MRRLISTGSPFEAAWGYSRAVVTADMVYVSGCTGFDYRTMSISDDVAAQTRQCWATIEAVLTEAGCTIADIVRVHYYVPDAADWPIVGETSGAVLAAVRPAATALVCALVDPRMKVEIEVTATLPPQPPADPGGNR
jgi:enamine deaminase RidA (YjgF/YER057c/UK114 family)